MSTLGNYDAIEQLIFDEKLSIEKVDFQREEICVILNTKASLHFPLSLFKGLAAADMSALGKYQIIAGGTGVHWPELDEDLSLKGFLQESLKQTIRNAAA
ncbi:MAG TPA: DUF2442 domain-containing protein [Flavipsychrobacter sp.]|nr:DUF2442 domain-containing protein [Flavipsychrobacter sp.]